MSIPAEATSKTAMELIHKLDTTLPVDAWAIGGIHIWPLVRFDIFNQIVIAPGRAAAVKQSSWPRLGYVSQLLAGFARQFKAYLGDWRRNQNLAQAPIALLFGASHRQKWGNYWYGVYQADPMIDIFLAPNQIPFLSLEMADQGRYRIPRASPSKMIWSQLTFFWAVARAHQMFGKPLERQLPEFDLYLKEMKERGLSGLGTADLLRQAGIILKLSGYFVKILARIKARSGFVVAYYGEAGFAFNLACRKLGIPSVDLQHGLQGSYHPGYGDWRRLPVEGFEILPRYFWTWSEREAIGINRWAASHAQWHQGIVGGNLFIRLWQEGHARVLDGLNKTSNFASSKPGMRTIAVTLQNELPVAPHLFEAIQRTHDKYRWLFRFHPLTSAAEKEDVCKALRARGVEQGDIDLPTRMPLFQLLGLSDVNVTHYSSTVWEAAAFGLPSILLTAQGAINFADAVEEGIAFPAMTAETLEKTLERLFAEGRKQSLKKGEGLSLDDFRRKFT